MIPIQYIRLTIYLCKLQNWCGRVSGDCKLLHYLRLDWITWRVSGAIYCSNPCFSARKYDAPAHYHETGISLVSSDKEKNSGTTPQRQREQERPNSPKDSTGLVCRRQRFTGFNLLYLVLFASRQDRAWASQARSGPSSRWASHPQHQGPLKALFDS